MGRRRHGEPGAQSKRWIIHGPSSRSLCVPFCYLCLHLKGTVGWGLSCFEHHILSWSLKRRAIPGGGWRPWEAAPPLGAFLATEYIYLPAWGLNTAGTQELEGDALQWCSQDSLLACITLFPYHPPPAPATAGKHGPTGTSLLCQTENLGGDINGVMTWV